MIKSNAQPILLVFVGMPGAGKSSCIDYITKHKEKLPVLYFGGITISEVKRRGLEVNEPNERLVREAMRSKEGKESHAKRIAAQADKLIARGQKRILVDGLYSWSEYKFFKQHYGKNAIIVATTSNRRIRHQRLLNRPIRPFTEEQVTDREYAEIENLEKGGPIACADYTLLNNSGTANLFAQIDDLLEEIKF